MGEEALGWHLLPRSPASVTVSVTVMRASLASWRSVARGPPEGPWGAKEEGDEGGGSPGRGLRVPPRCASAFAHLRRTPVL